MERRKRRPKKQVPCVKEIFNAREHDREFVTAADWDCCG